MNKSVVFAFVFGVVAVMIAAQDEATIKNLRPFNGAHVNECPTFSWAKKTGSKVKYTLTVKKGSTTIWTKKDLSNPRYEVTPYDMADFMPSTGEYTWKVTTNNNDFSDNYKFTVDALSCLPPKSENKILNTLTGFNQEGKAHDGTKVTKWGLDDNETLQLDGKQVVFYPNLGEKIYAMKIHETFGEIPAREAMTSDLYVRIVPDENDYILAFRYIHYTSGNSTVHVYIDDGQGDKYLGCIGTKSRVTGVKCEDYSEDTNATLGRTQRYTPSLKEKKWGFFKRVLSKEMIGGQEFTLHLFYERADRLSDDHIPCPSGRCNANFLFYVSEFTFGQCSSIPSDYYDAGNTSIPVDDDINNDCPNCKSAAMRYPKSYTGHCQTCSSYKQKTDACLAIDYCVPCTTTGCDPVSESTCRAESNCAPKESQLDCENEDNCVWCGVDGKCIFIQDEYLDPKSGGCTFCSNFSSKDDCQEHSSDCAWCSTLQYCLQKEDTCPGCTIIEKDKCTYEQTDGACAYCNSQGKCLATSLECNGTCALATTPETCGGDDCLWCGSSQKCTEYRVECKNCSHFQSDQCDKTLYPGCNLCESGYCVTDLSTCPACDGRAKDVCDHEGDIPLKCSYCVSEKVCQKPEKECVSCSSLNGTKECSDHPGCAFCSADLVCKNSDNLAGCDCGGLSTLTCSQHDGCCYSSTPVAGVNCFGKTYNSEKNEWELDEHCKEGLSTTTIIIICVVVGVVILAAAILIPVLVINCKPKPADQIEMTGSTIVVLPEGQPSMVVQESLQSVNVDPATAVSVDETTNSVAPAQPSVQDMQMQNMMAQNLMLNTMMANSMMNPMMMNSMGMMNMSGMAGMSGMNSMGMDMNSMNMTGGMNSMNMTGGMNSMNMTGGMNSMNMTGGMNMTGDMANPQQGNGAAAAANPAQ